ncbi:MAG: hypothetical protein P4L56_23155 [Candidatus Sulfopaludibacter sp.]|nr:hypothetical protein [Candidatus Sulfopaludibacter sp.]
MKPPAVAAVCFGLAVLSFFRYPGHTWLQQDTQIYVPILEHQRDPTLLRNDLLVQQPQVAFTLYDEIARSLRALSGQSFREVLAAQQIVTRALGIWGFYLMATALGFSAAPAFLIASVCALGARITGPEVLSFEYEPTPRAFAVPLLFCAIGLTAHRRYLAAGIAAACAFLYHPPTALPFWALFIVLAIAARNWKSLIPLLLSAALLALMAQSDGSPPPFGQLTPLQEQLQRMRAAYSWVSTWHVAWILHYCMLCVIAAIAFARLHSRIPRELKLFLVGLPLLGMLSMPVSWLLLEHWKWLLVPQFQPMRALLFVAVAMQFLTAAAGACAAIDRRWPEAVAWFALAYLLPLQPVLTEGLSWRFCLALPLVAVALAAVRFPVLSVAAFLVLPVAYPQLHTPELAQLSAWARTSTPRDAVFLFPDEGHGLASGIFRVEALRAVFVDWKSGGQVNYRRDFAEQWWTRWQLTMNGPIDPARYDALGIAYIVVKPQHRLSRPPAFQNADFVAYRTIPQ